MADLATLRAQARAHQADLDLTIVYLTPQELAVRWSIAVSTVHGIPRDELPYKAMGNGHTLKRRRYHPADILAYEQRDRSSAA